MPDPSPDPGRPGRLSRVAAEFLTTETAGAAALAAATAVAIVWANSPWRHGYASLWATRASLRVAGHGPSLDLHGWVNDGLMALFFLVVGVEIKRELVLGDLRHWRRAALPALAALGGMAVPAAIYAALNAGRPGAHGWGIPMATDIAFAVGVLALVASRVAPGMKLFLLTLAIVDDVGAIVVIAVFYSEALDVVPLVGAAATLAVVGLLWRLGVRAWPVHAVAGVVLWYLTLRSGVHATIAGVALGLLVPAATAPRVEHRLHPVTGFAVVPVFALANAGVRFDGSALHAPGAGWVLAGVVVGLVVGKLVGIWAVTTAAARVGLGVLPDEAGSRDVAGTAALAGIGFTVSLFVAELAFGDSPLGDAARLGILGASVLAALVGCTVLVAGSRSGRV